MHAEVAVRGAQEILQIAKAQSFTCCQRALTIPSRIRPWISGSGRKLRTLAARFMGWVALSAILSGYHKAKSHMQPAKPGGKHPMGKRY